MNSLPTLIKLAQRNIDAIGVEIAKGQARIEELRLQKETSATKVEVEKALASDGLALNLLGGMPVFIERQKWQQEQIDIQIAEIQKGMEEVRERLIAAYREKSKLENLATQYQEKERKELALKEQAMLDEAALTRRA
ncbi:flagellar export protein FliJ [Hirschia maritima]|uniref:flagellar export protein FliJ n=1 Tax=Hirschia maritima TaxID=1121961 RepID=UPI00036DBC82|nr:flagellar export protein FliJ [Hirschia maritima]